MGLELKCTDAHIKTKLLLNVTQDQLDVGMVYYENLTVDKEDFRRLQIPKSKYQEALSNMVAIVEANPSRNTRKYLLGYLKRNYEKKND